jgi:NitT/TauT family transport system substrate-binding protein
MRTPFRIIRGAAGIIVALAVVALLDLPRQACAQDNVLAVGAAGKPEKSELALGMVPVADHIPIMLGIKEGIFQSEGLAVTPRMNSVANSLAGIVSGSLDAASVPWIQFLVASREGISLRVVAEVNRGTPGYASYSVPAASPIRKVSDFPGKKIAVVNANGPCDLLLNDYLKKQGVRYADINYVTVPVPDMTPTLLREGVDAACLPEPVLTVARQQGGIREIYDLFSGDYSGWPIGGYCVSANFAEKNPNTIGALQRSLERARKLANDRPALARAIIPSFIPIPADIAGKMVLPEFPLDNDPALGIKKASDMLDRLNFFAAK